MRDDGAFTYSAAAARNAYYAGFGASVERNDGVVIVVSGVLNPCQTNSLKVFPHYTISRASFKIYEKAGMRRGTVESHGAKAKPVYCFPSRTSDRQRFKAETELVWLLTTGIFLFFASLTTGLTMLWDMVPVKIMMASMPSILFASFGAI